ncbi:MAG TPA: POTRA domain-containing protein [Bacteroidales bacterium]|nr:MAG: Outer membrane protein assembly factor BamA precursor [Bacteroidetes bacterium ADurb.Bin139]HOG24707.1 POTRA domain-containing protein [Bacteroidales bacterium]HOR11077.1 POTRA domain-containing protein [Bacteroidales bacterium]HOZ19838.1 POTRA domain-containing protein [Bacteroidales bacterium]HPB77878.1 POTRA domain-containing protein [Bacteroidales bacterium]|eukprot:GDKH01005618.1.p1 GENE.GDKH01005618.1~~GDKH01005618.1.p1  ORF type:complete len:847 (+),score=126.53 GDKH01005618.1:9935-12475(+)
MKHLIFCITFYSLTIPIQAQVTEQSAVPDTTGRNQRSVVIDYSNPRKCVIAGLQVTGVNYLNSDQILSLTGLALGDTISIPGDELKTIVKRLFMQRFFSDVTIYVDSLVDNNAYLNINIAERPRVSQWKYEGVKKGEQTDIEERVRLRRGSELSEYVIKSSSDIIRKYYVEKGFLNARVTASHKEDTTIKNAVQVTFHVDRKEKVRIKEIRFIGSEQLSLLKMRFAMKKTKDKRLYNFFFSKKFDEKEFQNDKQLLIQKFHELGYRDAHIAKDSIYHIDDKNLGIDLHIVEGKKYYFRNITWTGNTQYSGEMLNSVLRIGKGDVYDVVTMEERLFGGGKSQQGNVSQVYKDQGYLFFRVVPVEVNIEQDSVDVEMRIFEGKPATYNRIIINGNNVSNEKIIRRQVFTRPGYLFSQTELERSIREIASMGHFDQEAIMQMGSGFNVVPNQINNTVDIIYNVTEKPDSQFEIAGGWGGNTFVGTVGISFNNFSIKRLFDKQAWRPVPLGDGQTLSLRFQTNGTYYMALSVNFVEPWLTGEKPTSFSTSIYYTRQTASTYYYLTNDQFMEVYGLGIGLGTRLKWPDNYFVFYNQLDIKRYNLQDWGYYFMFTDGQSNIIDYSITLQRNSTDQIIYPRQGSDFKFGLQVTPPYSLFRAKNTDYQSMTDPQRYRWIEYHKWTFDANLYTRIIGDLVLMTRANFGYLGFYNRKLGYSPFEGFMLGGDGMSGYNTYGADIISQRGYSNYSLTPSINNAYAGRVYTRYTVELRYPVILQPQSTIYALLFLEGGNCWSDIRDFNPFSIKRAAGVGVRVFLPMVGLLGIDWGYGFDTDFSGKKGGSNFHFMIGQQF